MCDINKIASVAVKAIGDVPESFDKFLKHEAIQTLSNGLFIGFTQPTSYIKELAKRIADIMGKKR